MKLLKYQSVQSQVNEPALPLVAFSQDGGPGASAHVRGTARRLDAERSPGDGYRPCAEADRCECNRKAISSASSVLTDI